MQERSKSPHATQLVKRGDWRPEAVLVQFTAGVYWLHCSTQAQGPFTPSAERCVNYPQDCI